MELHHKLEMKMLQKLVLTPQLQQAIKLLQMPQLELSQTLTNELVENPFLEEVSEGAQPEEAPQEVSEAEGFEESSDDAEMSLEKFIGETDGGGVEQLLGFSADDYFDSRSSDGRDLGYFAPDSEAVPSYEQFASQDSDLYEHLTWQLSFVDASDAVKTAAEVVIGNIDENGYLQSSDEDIARYADVSAEEAGQAIALVQSFDPLGVGARDLKECLRLQLEPLKLRGSLVEDLIMHNLPDMERRKYPQLAQQYKCTVEDIMGAVKVIEGLEPKPGRGFSNLQPIYITPDVYVVRSDDGFHIILNDESMPRIRINNYYRKLLMQKNTLQKEEKAYLEERLRSAVWLLKSLDHRNKTIYRVTESILKFQVEFFEQGVSRLKPLNLKDVAMDLEMHESTISRATSNKYLSCSHGLFNFRYFFSSSLRSDAGAVSSTSVKDTIARIIGEEDPARPLSDQKIADMLNDLNVSVARRTVAKYRDELNIPPQNKRKRFQ
jgi:RNA polymerase sigma-54 factor